MTSQHHPSERNRRSWRCEAGCVPPFTACPAPQRTMHTCVHSRLPETGVVRRPSRSHLGREVLTQVAEGQTIGLGGRDSPSWFQTGLSILPSTYPPMCHLAFPTHHVLTHHPLVSPLLTQSGTALSIVPSAHHSHDPIHPRTQPPSPICLHMSMYPSTDHHQSINLSMRLVFHQSIDPSV